MRASEISRENFTGDGSKSNTPKDAVRALAHASRDLWAHELSRPAVFEVAYFVVASATTRIN